MTKSCLSLAAANFSLSPMGRLTRPLTRRFRDVVIRAYVVYDQGLNRLRAQNVSESGLRGCPSMLNPVVSADALARLSAATAASVVLVGIYSAGLRVSPLIPGNRLRTRGGFGVSGVDSCRSGSERLRPSWTCACVNARVFANEA